MPGLMNNSIEFKPTFVAYLFSISVALFGLIACFLTFSTGSTDIGVLISLSFLDLGFGPFGALLSKNQFSMVRREFFIRMKSLSVLTISVQYSYYENM